MASFPSLHPVHALWRMLPAGPRRRMLTGGLALLAPRPDRTPPAACAGIIVGGELGRASGLGEAARLTVAGLASLGITHWQIEAGIQPFGENIFAGSIMNLPEGAPLLLVVNPPLLPAALLRLPRRLMRGRKVIGYWPWELPVAPPNWRVAATFVHEIWTPSRFSAAALEPLLPGRVRVVPHPVAVAPPAPSGLARADFNLPEAAVVTLVSFSLASSFARKNPLGAIAAFREAFGTRRDRVLVLKVHGAAHAPADMAAIAAAIADNPNIKLETRNLPTADNHALTRHADIVLSLHRSEGFGLVPAEAMLLGRCVVATDWSATAEFVDASCGVPIPFQLIPSRDPRGVYDVPHALWADPDTHAAATALRDLAASPDRRIALGAAARGAAQARLGIGGLREAVLALGLKVAA